MSRNFLATFERFTEPADDFSDEAGTWEEVCREWVSLTPQPIATQRTEFVDAAQVKVTQKTIATAVWSPTLAGVDVKCRVKVCSRVFGIDNILNADERNRELQFLLTEKAGVS